MNKKLKRLLGIAGGLALYYTITGNYQEEVPGQKKYPLPEQIKVIQANYTDKSGEQVHLNGKNIHFDEVRNSKGLEEKVINTNNIDFSKHMQITTERYNFSRNEDFKISQGIGWLVSLPRRLFFFDYGVSNGLSSEKTKSVLAMLENDSTLKNLTVRVNHNQPLYDTKRLFTDPTIKERNGFLARALLGTQITLGAELFSELSRGDYYNPMTQSLALYSDVESISLHEMGHHKDFQRFKRDWIYNALRPIAPVTLYQEARASLFARKDLSDSDKYQFARYLIPAFLTYVLYSINQLKKAKRKFKGDEEF